MKRTTLAYLAGLIDGEGYIGIKRTSRRDAISPIYHERIQVRMVHENSIRLLTDTLGGHYYREQTHALNRRPLYCWQASDLLAATILKLLLPYLVVKHASALTVLALRTSKRDPKARRRGSPARRTMNPTVLALRESLYARAKELNRVGLQP